MPLVECGPEERAAALALYREGCAPGPFLILAVLQNLQPGRVFVDRLPEPRAAFVVTRFGFCVLFGRGTDGFHAALSEKLQTAGSLGPSYLLWYSPPAEWRGLLDPLTPTPVRRRERVRFEFEGSAASYIEEAEACPPELALRELTADLLPSTRSLKVDLESRFWSSGEDFLRHGVGVGLFRGGEIVSLCYSACVADGHAEVDIATDAQYRTRGFGALVGRAFVRACMRKGITPAWDAFAENEGSVRLAKALGFRPRISYDFYTFPLPLRLPADELTFKATENA